MNFRWLQFWGDLRQGLHEEWQEDMSAMLPPRQMLAYHHRASAAALRHRLGVAHAWDTYFTPDQAPWLMLGREDFNRWCEAVGLLTLGEHLKRILSVRAVQRLKVTLDRHTLSMLLTHVQPTSPGASSALPLDLPPAHELGARALGVVVARHFPAVWSRFRLRLDPMVSAHPETAASPLVQVPDIAALLRLDEALFNQTLSGRMAAAEQPEDQEASWIRSRTLSA